MLAEITFPKRHVDTRITRLYRRFGVSKVFSLAQGAEALHVDHDVAFRLLMVQQISDSRFRVAINNGQFWLLSQNPFVEAAKMWASQYAPIFRELPSSFSTQEFATATGIPYTAANTMLSILLQHGHLHRATTFADEGNPLYRLTARRKVKIAA